MAPDTILVCNRLSAYSNGGRPAGANPPGLRARLVRIRANCLSTGFSLAELMLVVAIIGLLASLAAPLLMRSLRRTGTDFAADEFMARFSSARSFAISRNTYSKFIFDPGTDSYRIRVYDPATVTWQDVEQVFFLPERIHFSDGSTFPGMAATFDPYGSLDFGGEVAIADVDGYEIKMKAFLANGQLNRME